MSKELQVPMKTLCEVSAELLDAFIRAERLHRSLAD